MFNTDIKKLDSNQLKGIQDLDDLAAQQVSGGDFKLSQGGRPGRVSRPDGAVVQLQTRATTVRVVNDGEPLGPREGFLLQFYRGQGRTDRPPVANIFARNNIPVDVPNGLVGNGDVRVRALDIPRDAQGVAGGNPSSLEGSVLI